MEIVMQILGYCFLFGVGVIMMFFGGLGGSHPAFFGGVCVIGSSGFLAAYNTLPKFFNVDQPLITLTVLGADASLSINFAISLLPAALVIGLGYYLLFKR